MGLRDIFRADSKGLNSLDRILFIILFGGFGLVASWRLLLTLYEVSTGSNYPVWGGIVTILICALMIWYCWKRVVEFIPHADSTIPNARLRGLFGWPGGLAIYWALANLYAIYDGGNYGDYLGLLISALVILYSWKRTVDLKPRPEKPEGEDV